MYTQASELKELLKQIVSKMIEEHPLVKSAIKAKKAIVTQPPNTTDKTVKIKFPFDNTEITLPYNPHLTTADLTVGKYVSVWFYQSIQNGIVMQNANWTA